MTFLSASSFPSMVTNVKRIHKRQNKQREGSMRPVPTPPTRSLQSTDSSEPRGGKFYSLEVTQEDAESSESSGDIMQPEVQGLKRTHLITS